MSHELRTPLTAIGGWSETLLSGGGSVDTAEAQRGLSIILRETRRLTGMVEDLLEFTRMQDGRFTLNVAPADLRAEFEDTVFMYGSRLQREGIELEYLENDEDIPEIPCDKERMRQVFLNILDNAVKHGGEGGKITAEMRREDDEVVIRIRDFGCGIPAEELPLVKKKFYKGSSKARGSGIGLAVCEEIVSMHNGTLTGERPRRRNARHHPSADRIGAAMAKKSRIHRKIQDHDRRSGADRGHHDVGPDKSSVVVRKKDGLRIKTEPRKVSEGFSLKKLPLIRGVFNFCASMKMGVTALLYSADVYAEDDEEAAQEPQSRLDAWLEKAPVLREGAERHDHAGGRRRHRLLRGAVLRPAVADRQRHQPLPHGQRAGAQPA